MWPSPTDKSGAASGGRTFLGLVFFLLGSERKRNREGQTLSPLGTGVLAWRFFSDTGNPSVDSSPFDVIRNLIPGASLFFSSLLSLSLSPTG